MVAGLELIDVALLDKEKSMLQQGSTHIVPLRIVVRGPAELSDRAYEYIIAVLEDEKKATGMYLKTEDYNAFNDVEIVYKKESYDFLNDDVGMASSSVYQDPSSAASNAVAINNAVEMEEQDFLVNYVFKNIAGEYKLSASDRASIVRSVNDMLDENLPDSLDLMQVKSARKMDHSVPLRITVKGGKAEAGFALALLMETLEDHKDDMMMLVKSMSWSAFKKANISIEEYDPSAVAADQPDPPRVEKKQTLHPVQLVFRGLPNGYKFSPSDRSKLIRSTKVLLEESIDNSLTLIGVQYIGEDDDTAGVLPLLVSVEGPETDADFALSFVMQALEKQVSELEKRAKTIDFNSFRNVVITAEPYDPDAEPLVEVVDLAETTHAVQITLDNLPSGYQPSDETISSIIRFIKGLMEEKLFDSFSLVGVTKVSRGFRDRDMFSLPLEISVAGPRTDSDLALSYVMDVFQDNKQTILQKLKSIDGDNFRGASISASTYDPANLPEPQEPVKMIETEHLVQLDLDGLSGDYSISPAHRASIIRFTDNLLTDNLDSSMELESVADASKGGKPAVSVPLRVKVNGPEDQADYALSFIMDVLDQHEQEMIEYLKTLDRVSDVGILPNFQAILLLLCNSHLLLIPNRMHIETLVFLHQPTTPSLLSLSTSQQN